jgi:hypothetical protein
MLAKRSFLVFASLLFTSTSAWPVYDLPSSVKAYWQDVGVIGAIPTVTNLNTLPNYTNYDNGVADATMVINSCLSDPSYNGCYLPAGIYRANSLIIVPSNKVLRGAGFTQTQILSYISGGSGILLGGGRDNDYSSRSMIASGATNGSTQIVLASGEGAKYSVGDQIYIEQDRSADIGSSMISWCGYWNGSTNSGRPESQYTNVRSKSGDTLNLSTRVHRDFTSPWITKSTVTINAGVESLYIEMKVNQASTWSIALLSTSNCWIKDVKSYMAGSNHLRVESSNNATIMRCWVEDGYNHGGNASYGINLVDFSSNIYVYNNIARRCRHSFIMECGGVGNVFAYNYSVDPYDDSTNPWPDLAPDIVHHGGYAMLNLWEGNVGSRITGDNELGGNMRNVYFRNQGQARSNADGINIPNIGLWGFEIEANNWYYYEIGGVAGAPGYSTYTQDIRWGYSSNGGSYTDATSQATGVLHGLYSFKNDNVTWNGSDDRTLPKSFYLSGKPCWFGKLTWPAIGPDVNGYVSDIPAKVFYDTGTWPAVCTSDQGVTPSSPSALTAVAH